MNTKINLTYKGTPYTLEYDRNSVKMLEASGFKLTEFLDKPMVNIELAFTGAFIKNHKKVNQTVIDEIFESCPDKNDLVAIINKMINECYESLLEEPKEEQVGNVSWEVVDLSPVESKNKK